MESGNTYDLQERHIKSINPVYIIEKKDLIIPFPLLNGPLEYKKTVSIRPSYAR